LNGSNDRKEHNYHWWITSEIHFDDYYWSYGLRWGTKTALLLKPRYFHHWYTVIENCKNGKGRLHKIYEATGEGVGMLCVGRFDAQYRV
jgi:hypothetical protein